MDNFGHARDLGKYFFIQEGLHSLSDDGYDWIGYVEIKNGHEIERVGLMKDNDKFSKGAVHTVIGDNSEIVIIPSVKPDHPRASNVFIDLDTGNVTHGCNSVNSISLVKYDFNIKGTEYIF